VAGEAPFEVGELLRTIELVGVDCELLLVQPCLNRLADWLDDEDAPELARRLLMIPGKHLFEPVERAGSGPTIQRELLGVVAAGGGNTLLADGGMPIKAGLLLSRVDRLWPRLTPEQRAALAPRVVVWAFQTGIAINLSMYTNVGKGLFRASARHQLSTHWEQAIGPGLHAAVPALTAVLTMESKETADEPLWYWLAVAWVRDFVDQHPEEHHLRRGLKLTLLPVEWVLKHVLQQVAPDRAEAMMRRAVAVGISGLPSGEVAHRLALEKLLETVPVPDDVSERRSRPFRVGLPGKWKRETGE
jgi:hypothetical protein